MADEMEGPSKGEKNAGLGTAAAQGAAAGAVFGPWGAAIGAVLAVGVQLIKGKGAQQIAEAKFKAGQRVAKAANQQRSAKNDTAKASAELNRAVQDINNERTMAAGVKTDAAAKEQLAALHDAQSARSFEGRIKAAERAGNLQTQAALAGVTGGSFEVIQGTLALQRARQEEIQARANQGQSSMLEVGMGQAASNLVAGLDTRAINATLDRTVTPDPYHDKGPSMVNSLVEGINSVGAKNIGGIAEGVWGEVKGKMAEWNWKPEGAAATGVGSGANPY